MTAALMALVGGAWGCIARHIVRRDTFRRPDDRPPRRLRWAVPAGALVAPACWRLAAPLPVPGRVVALAATGVLLLLALVDADVHRLPDVLTRPLGIGLLLADAVASAIQRDPGPLIGGIGGGLGLYAAFFTLAMIGSGIGYGDVKLAAACGCGLGALGLAPCVAMPLAGFVLGGLGAIGLLVTGRARRRDPIALGPALAAGAVIALAWA